MQPPNFNGNFWASQNDTNPGGFGNFATAYDNFTIYSLKKPYRIDDVEWFGGYFNGTGSSITGGQFPFTPIWRLTAWTPSRAMSSKLGPLPPTLKCAVCSK